MKQAFLLSLIILRILLSESSTSTTNTQDYIQICPRNNSNESQKKQCCLKEAFNANIKYKDLCVFNNNKDVITPYVYIIDSISNNAKNALSTCSCSNNTNETCQKDDSIQKTASSNFTINPSLSLDFSKKNEINTNIAYQNKNNNAVASKKTYPNTNINVNNIHIENEKNKDICESPINYLIDKKYLVLIITFFCVLIVSLATLLIPSLKLFKVIYTLKRALVLFDKIYELYEFIKLFFSKLLFNLKTYNILSPTNDAEKFSSNCETFNQLKFAIIDDHQEIKNIAITGPYGSGKSSVWKTFCKKTNISKFKNIVEISLAKFNDPNEENNSQTYSEAEIERAIIQQFIFSKKQNDLKYSNYPRINNLTDLKTSLLAAFILTFISLTLPLASNSIACIIKSWLEHPFQLETIYIPITLLSLYISIFIIIQKINKLRISKICLKEIEITVENNESLFSKYLNEIIYFFEATKCNCVVIEDLDRFKSLKIFIKLREINNLINNYPTTKNKVKFIYLVKDDILTAYERTKFFDYIIPIVPILEGRFDTISYIKSHFLREDPFDYKNEKPYLRDEYLNKIKKYLDDLRLIKNCFNELKIFKEINPNQYHGEKGDENIFSLILLKNRNPKHFQHLLAGKGYLYYCLNQAIIDLDKGEETNGINYFSQIRS